jgi:hypothetical protein
MAKSLALTALLLLAAAPLYPARSRTAAQQLGVPGGLVFRRSRPWIKTAPGGLTIDLRGQFDPMTRRQGRYGTCSAFAAVAVAEAAADRNAHRCVRLSEADLYLQGNVLKWKCWNDPKKDCNTSGSGTSIVAMLHDLITEGVLPGDDYERFMGAFQKALDEDRAVAGEPHDRLHGLMALLRNPFNDELLNELMGWDQKAVRRHLDAYASASRRADLRRVRLSVARSFQGYRLVRGLSETVLDRWKMKPGSECFERGKKVARFIDGELLAGRPVGIGMYVGDLAGWPTTAKGSESGHAFVIDGLTLTRDASGVKKIYHTRNSWPAQPDVPAEALCRVDAAVSLLGPGEPPAPENPWASLR